MSGEKVMLQDNYYPMDYNAVHVNYEKKNAENHNRYVKFEHRENRTVLDHDMFKVLTSGKHQTNWNGVEVLKGPFEIVSLFDFFNRERPATVIELGSYTGGSALWMADTLKCFGIKSHIYSVDITFDDLHERTKGRDDITFIKGDLRQIEKLFPEKMLKGLPHPWFVVEDSHVHLDIILGYLDRFMEPGDYLLVEDTNPHVLTRPGQGFDFKDAAAEKLRGLAEFMKTRSEKYRVDCHYNDFFGYNATWNMNGFLKRI